MRVVRRCTSLLYVHEDAQFERWELLGKAYLVLEEDGRGTTISME